MGFFIDGELDGVTPNENEASQTTAKQDEEIKEELPDVQVDLKRGGSVLDLGANKQQARPLSTQNKQLTLDPNKEYVKVVQDYTKQQQDELTIKVGDLVEVLKKFEDAWWEGAVNGEKGLFPSTFTEPYHVNKKDTNTNGATEDGWNVNFNSLPEDKPNVQPEEEEEVTEEKVSEEEEEEEEEEEGEEEEEEVEEEEGEEEEVEEEEGEEEEEEEEEGGEMEEEVAEEEVETKNTSQAPVVPKEEKREPVVEQPPVKPQTPVKVQSAVPKENSNSAVREQNNTIKPVANHEIGKPVSGSEARTTKEKKPRGNSAFDQYKRKWATVVEKPPIDSNIDTRLKSEPGYKEKTVPSKVEKSFLATFTGNDIRKYRDALVAKEREIAELKKEIKTLNVLQKRQTKAIKDMDHQKGELPRVMSQLYEEVRVLKEKAKEYQTRHALDEKSLQAQHEEILKLKQQCTDLQATLKAKGRDPISVTKKAKAEIEERDKKIVELQHKAFVLQKAKEQDEKKYELHVKESAKEIENLKLELEKYKNILRENGLNRILRQEGAWSPSNTVNKSPESTINHAPTETPEKTHKTPKKSSPNSTMQINKKKKDVTPLQAKKNSTSPSKAIAKSEKKEPKKQSVAKATNELPPSEKAKEKNIEEKKKIEAPAASTPSSSSSSSSRPSDAENQVPNRPPSQKREENVQTTKSQTPPIQITTRIEQPPLDNSWLPSGGDFAKPAFKNTPSTHSMPPQNGYVPTNLQYNPTQPTNTTTAPTAPISQATAYQPTTYQPTPPMYSQPTNQNGYTPSFASPQMKFPTTSYQPTSYQPTSYQPTTYPNPTPAPQMNNNNPMMGAMQNNQPAAPVENKPIWFQPYNAPKAGGSFDIFKPNFGGATAKRDRWKLDS